MFFSAHRTLIQSLGLSLLVHAVLLTKQVSTFPLQPGVPVVAMRAVIVSEKRSEPAKSLDTPLARPISKPFVAPTSSKLPDRSAETMSKRLVRQAEGSKAAAREPSQQVAHDSALESVSSGTEKSSAQQVAPSSLMAVAPVPAATGGVGKEAARGAEVVNADDMRQYRVALASAARRYKRYPALARERGWEGTVEVAIRFSAPLPGPEVALVRSSGHALLDEQAVELMSQAARATALPDSLKGRDFQIPLPVMFSLDETR